MKIHASIKSLLLWCTVIILSMNSMSSVSAITQEKWHSQPNITNNIEIAQKLIEQAEKKEIKPEDLKKEAENAYANLERAMIFQKNFNPNDTVSVADAEYMLFQLSNIFNLQTPIEKLKRDYEGSVSWFNGLWSKAHSVATTSIDTLINNARKGQQWALDQTLYLTHNLGQTITPENAIKILGTYVYTPKVKEIIKKTYMRFNPDFIEPSPKIKELADEAIKNCDLDPEKIIVLEDTGKNRHYDAYVRPLPPYNVMVITSLKNDSELNLKTKSFSIYHECGHLYHGHTAKRVIAPSLAFVGAMGVSLDLKKILSNVLPPMVAILTACLPIAFGLATAYFSYSREQEKEADLFACNKLFVLGKSDVVVSDINANRGSPENFESNILSNILSGDTHPSVPERNKYLTECLNRHGYEMPPQHCISLANATKSKFRIWINSPSMSSYIDVEPGQTKELEITADPRDKGMAIIINEEGAGYRVFEVDVLYKQSTKKCLHLTVHGPDADGRYTLSVEDGKTYQSEFHKHPLKIKDVLEL